MAEKRLIDASAVLETQFTAGLSDASGNYYGNADVVLASDIENAPTVDAAEVVRCRDCKHQTAMWCWRAEEGMNPRRVGSNDFCSYGERKDGDGNG